MTVCGIIEGWVQVVRTADGSVFLIRDGLPLLAADETRGSIMVS